jgi:YD repeat-containing protein
LTGGRTVVVPELSVIDVRLPKASKAYAYDDGDRLTSVTEPGQGATAYTWDDNGNLTNRGNDTLAWNYEDRMTSATVGGLATTFAYRGDGLRNSRTTGANTTAFTWDVNAGLPVVLDDGTQYVFGAGLISRVVGTNTYYYLADGLGSTMKAIDVSGNVVNGYEYDVYGQVKSGSGPAGTSTSLRGRGWMGRQGCITCERGITT